MRIVETKIGENVMDIEDVKNVGNNLPNNLSNKVSTSPGGGINPDLEMMDPTKVKKPDVVGPNNDVESAKPEESDVMDPEGEDVLDPENDNPSKKSKKDESEEKNDDKEGEKEDVLDPEAEKEDNKKDDKDDKKDDKDKKEDGEDSGENKGDSSKDSGSDALNKGDSSDLGSKGDGTSPSETGSSGADNALGSKGPDVSSTGGANVGTPGGNAPSPTGGAPSGANLTPGGSPTPATGTPVGGTPTGTPTVTPPAAPVAGGTAGATGGAAGATGGAAGATEGAGGLLSNPYVLIAVVIIIVLIGLIGFILNMPGLLVGKIKQIAQDVWDNIETLFTTGADAFINDNDVTELAQYLVDMDYDLISYGFVRAKIEDDYDTFLDLEDDGYFMNSEGFYVKKDSDGNEIKYNGKYYNSAGKLIDNLTGKYYVVDSDYTKDKYGIRYWAADTEKDGTTYTKGTIAEVYDSGSDMFVASGATGDDKLLRAYLMSDYRIGFLRNNDEDIFNKIGDAVKKTFGGTPNAWTKGLIKLYKREGSTVSTFWNGGTSLWWNDVKIIDNGTKLSARKEWLNQPMEFELDGWTGRYGLSLEFLLSLHLGTMAPDLVTAMLENFDTEVQVYLQSVDNAEIETRYLEEEDATDEVTVDEIEDIIDENIHEGDFTEILNRLSISKADCLEMLHADIGIESQNNCTHFYHNELVELVTEDKEELFLLLGSIDVSDNPLADYGFEDSTIVDYINEAQDDYANYIGIDENGNEIEVDLAHCVKDLVSDTSYGEFRAPKTNGNDDKGYTKTYFSNSKLAQFGYDPNNLEVENYNIVENKTRVKGRQVIHEATSALEKVKVQHTYEISIIETTKEWTKKDFVDTAGVKHDEQWYELKSYKIVLRIVEQKVWKWKVVDAFSGYVYSHTNGPEKFDPYDHIYVWEFVVRDKTWEELEADGMIEDGVIKAADESTCSEDKSTKKCCTNCKNYVTNVIRAMAEVNDEKYEYFQPYIARVVGSWFRDTYFMIPTEKDKGIEDYEDDHPEWDSTGSYGGTSNSYIKVDEDYLYATNEYWTDYEMKTETLADGTVVETDEYQLYYLNPNGTTSSTTLEDWLKTEHQLRNSTETKKFANKEEAEKEGYVFVKKAKTLTLNQIKENVNKEEGGGRDLSEAPYMDGTAWSAYTLGDGGSSGWIEIPTSEGNKFVKKVKEINPEGRFEYQLLSTVSVEQEEDAIRTETNITVKNLFRYRQYYIFDGSIGRAEAIQADREKVLELVKAYINDEYSKSSAITDLRKYGRQALRTTYGVTTITSTADTDAVAEAWLEWQLDMYYRANNENGMSDVEKARFKLDEICTYGINHTYTNAEGEIVTYLDKEYYTSDNHSLDPRDRNLISTVNISKSSLDAFAILENVNTLDADYQYRDFKELIVELNYFDKEDLSEAIEEVFTWMVPNYTSVWPLIGTDKQNNEYGTLVHSQASVDFLIKVYEKLLEEEKVLESEPTEPDSDSDSDSENEELTQTETILELLKNVVSYSENDAVVSPVTGKIIAYGEHDRINVYTQEKEKVGYVKIQVMSYGTDKKTPSKSYFTKDMMPSSLSDEEKEEAVMGLNSFYDEYKDQCAGYILMIDGIDVTDLKNGFTSMTDADGNAIEYDSLCAYETQDSMALYNSKEQEKRDKENEAKTNAPYFISYNANYTTVGGDYLAQDTLGGYYVKEGAYLGKTQSPTDRTGVKYAVNAGMQNGSNPNIANPEDLVDENPEKNVDMQILYDEFVEETKNPDYLRIILLDTELTTVDNVEDYFPGFQEESGTSGRGIYKDLEQIDENSLYEDKIRAAMSYFVAQGFTNEGAAGIVGNMMAESSMDPTADNGLGYHGLCQWNTNYGWWDRICAWTASQGYNMYDFAGQVRAVYEASDRGGMTDERWEELQTMVNVERAAELFCVFYEAPVGGTDAPTWYGKGNLYQGLIKRKEYAKQALDIYLGNDTENE